MNMRLVLAPGLDGTGELFAGLCAALPRDWPISVIQYPVDRCLDEAELISFIREAAEGDSPYVLLAESFSTPLAIKFAASNPQHLQALILCAGFASSPVKGFVRWAGLLCPSHIFAMPLPMVVTKQFLTGSNAPISLLNSIRKAVGEVRPTVLSSRMKIVFECDMRDVLSSMRVPILYLQANQDRLVPVGAFEEMRRCRPSMLLRQIPGPHLLLQREPQACAEAVVAFIDSLAGARLTD